MMARPPRLHDRDLHAAARREDGAITADRLNQIRQQAQPKSPDKVLADARALNVRFRVSDKTQTGHPVRPVH